jgi:deoxyribonuclease-4
MTAMPIIGIHLSISGGPFRALEKAKELKLQAVQIFLKNSNRWIAKPYTGDVVKQFFEARSSVPGIKIFSHAGYLINLAGSGETLKKSLDSLSDEMDRAARLDIEHIVLHPGSHGGCGAGSGIERSAESLSLVISKNQKTKILLETTAGQGSSIGHRFEYLRSIIDKTSRGEALGVCLDTCHIFAAGYDITTEKKLNAVIGEFDDILGIDKLKLIHINDSKRECGSKVDRHEHIGKGRIGTRVFSLILNHPRLKTIPMILETPKFNDDEADRMNLKKVRMLIR